MTRKRDSELGMDRPIARRDFLQGAAVAAAAFSTMPPALAAATEGEKLAQNNPGYYPPTREGMRGSHPGSFEAAHEVRDGDFWNHAQGLEDTSESFDLVIAGGGISGLSAAHFYLQAKPKAKILIIENHDDFGGHAKRNEFHMGGRMLLLNGGTMGIESPYPYSKVADGLLKHLGVHPVELSKECNDPAIYKGLKQAVYFDKETFGADKLVVGGGPYEKPDRNAIHGFLTRTPLSEVVQRDILRIETGMDDAMPGLTSDQKKDRLSRMSYQDYLLNVLKADAGIVPYYLHYTDDLWGCGIDAVSAIDCWGVGLPGFQGLKLAQGATARMGFTPAGFAATGGSYKFHYPDGNASIARLLVRDLCSGVLTGHDARDIVTAKADYSQLDKPNASVRIRLSNMVVRVRNVGSPNKPRGVEVAYTPSAGGGKVYRVHAKACVLASWNMMIPYICPQLPEEQKAALHKLVKTPLVYTSVALRNWKAFAKLGIRSVSAPGGYYFHFRLNDPVNIGNYRSPHAPDDPMLVFMLRTPASPGLPEREQHKAGRAELLTTPFETFERNIRDQLGLTLSAGGFDPAQDITGITVNRWPHGYAPEYNALIDGNTPRDRMPNLIGRKRFGRIAIANSDAGMAAYTDVAIDQAHRAVQELLET